VTGAKLRALFGHHRDSRKAAGARLRRTVAPGGFTKLLRPPAETGDWVQVLQADPRLAAAVPPATRDDAAVYTFAHTLWLEPGQWEPMREGAGDLGLLVLDGFLVRQVQVIDRPPAELLGPGDLLHPWEPDHTEPFVAGSRWDVIEPARLAVLDRRFAAVIGRWPELVSAFLARAIARSRALLLNLAIGQLVGVDIRLLVLLWHIAERWGEHGENGAGDGCVVPVHLTHQLLASLISAQRPTVTSALANLSERGLISRRSDGLIVLHGEPPTEFRHLRSALR
jgi:CRP/FNR family cyclic AMP-dependent transcriptional regulator